MLLNKSLCKKQETEILDESWIFKKLNQGCSCDDLVINDYYDRLYCHPALSHDSFIPILFSIILVVIIIFSLIGSLTMAWIILKHKKMCITKNIFLLNLIITNLAAIVGVACFVGYYNIFQNWLFFESYCSISNLLSTATINGCSFTMIMMSYQRYRAILTPFKKELGLFKTLTCIAIIWMLSFSFAIPHFLSSYASTNYHVDILGSSIVRWDKCFDDKWKGTIIDHYKYVLISIQFVLPLLCFGIIYGQIIYSLFFKPVINDANNATNQRQKRKAGKMIIWVVLLFFILWLPHTLYFSFIKKLIEDKSHINYIVSNSVFLIAMATCVVDPGIYFLMNKRFNIGFKYVFRWIPFVKFDREIYDRELAN